MTTKTGAADIAREDVVSIRSPSYINRTADSTLVARVQKRFSDDRVETNISLNFFKDQVVPRTTPDGEVAFVAEEVLLATFMLSEEQARFVMDNIKHQLEKSQS